MSAWSGVPWWFSTIVFYIQLARVKYGEALWCRIQAWAASQSCGVTRYDFHISIIQDDSHIPLYFVVAGPSFSARGHFQHN